MLGSMPHLGARAPTRVAALVVAVLAHDLIYYVGSSSTSMAEVPYLMFRFGLGRALYTGALGLLVACLLRLRRELTPV